MAEVETRSPQRQQTRATRLRIAVLGTRGVPANYGGFETFAEELSIRLQARGHEVTVYGRSHYVPPDIRLLAGVKIRRLPAVRSKYLETVSHTAISILDAAFRGFDVLLVCNAVNALWCVVPRLTGQRVVLNVDGIERQRKKWNWLGKEIYRSSEKLAGWVADAVVTDARVIQQYYRDKFNLQTWFIPYGAPLGRVGEVETPQRLGLAPGGYLLYVSRLEPENNAHLVMEAYLKAGVDLPLVVVGDAPYGKAYLARLRTIARRGRILMPGAIYGEGYRQLLSHCFCYLHATEVGGTHPALIEAMGAGCLVIAHDSPENREVVGDCGILCSFYERRRLADLLRQAVERPGGHEQLKQLSQQRVRQCYNWKQVTDDYEKLFTQLVVGGARALGWCPQCGSVSRSRCRYLQTLYPS